MTSVYTYTFTAGNLQGTANDIKDALLRRLVADGHLPGGAEAWCNRYVVVAYERGWLGELWDRLSGTEKGKLHYRILVNPVVHELGASEPGSEG